MFEIGKAYEHSSGKTLTIVGSAHTHIHGWCLIGEDQRGDLMPVGNHEGAFANWALSETELPDDMNALQRECETI